MGNLLLFNPQNDLALASGVPGFTPPREPLRLARDGALLPFWWARKGDFVMADEMGAEKFLKLEYSLEGELFSDTSPQEINACTPWGWSAYTKNILLRSGIPSAMLPSDISLDRWRRLSNRNVTVRIHELIGTEPDLIPVEARNIRRAYLAIDAWNGDAVIKQPWSSSGRGVFFTKSISSSQLESYIKGFIARQGAVMVEKRREKTADFALLYFFSGNEAQFKGVSYFYTSPGGEYTGNAVESQQKLYELIEIDLTQTIHSIQNALEIIFRDSEYHGWLGVDMMIEQISAHKRIVPCVEVNMRMTMGVLAYLIAEKNSAFHGKILHLTGRQPQNREIDLSPVPGAKYHYLLS